MTITDLGQNGAVWLGVAGILLVLVLLIVYAVAGRS